MKRIIFGLLTTTLITIHASEQNHNEPFLMFGTQPIGGTNLPRNFRTMKDPLTSQDKNLSVGLDHLNASGSAEFFVEIMPNMIIKMREHGAREITVVDLREESHCFINNIPYFWHQADSEHVYGWYNNGKSAQQIIDDEAYRIAQMEKKGYATVVELYQKNKHKVKISDLKTINLQDEDIIKIETIMTEQQLANKHGLHYLRLPIFDGQSPTTEIIDDFVRYFREHKNNWYHFHCNKGAGRTTTFLAINDMIHNAKELDFEAILNRQKLLGGEDLLTLNYPSEAKIKIKKERLEQLKNFYQYCKENNDDFASSYSVWLNQKNEKPAQTQTIAPPADKLSDNQMHKKFKSMRIQL